MIFLDINFIFFHVYMYSVGGWAAHPPNKKRTGTSHTMLVPVPLLLRRLIQSSSFIERLRWWFLVAVPHPRFAAAGDGFNVVDDRQRGIVDFSGLRGAAGGECVNVAEKAAQCIRGRFHVRLYRALAGCGFVVGTLHVQCLDFVLHLGKRGDEGIDP